MKKTIVVATDFSYSALNAARYAAGMAFSIGADILLLHVYQIVVSYGQSSIIMAEENVREEAEINISGLKEQLIVKTCGQVNIVTEVRPGTVFHEIKAVCERVKPYAVIMGSQGTTASQRFFFGGDTIHAMKYLMWPLITVPPRAIFSSLKKICLACDFSKVIETIPADEIKSIVNYLGVELHVVNTGKEHTRNPDFTFEYSELKEMLKPLNPYYHFIPGGNTDEAIINFAENNHIDLLVVIPKRHDLLDKLIHKSHTRQLVLHSHVPIMALHQ
jgi:nucleotide-binding universal stress UspA family protein